MPLPDEASEVRNASRTSLSRCSADLSSKRASLTAKSVASTADASVAAQPKSPRRNALTKVAADACLTSQSLIVVEAATAGMMRRRRRIIFESTRRVAYRVGVEWRRFGCWAAGAGATLKRQRWGRQQL